MTTSTGTWTGRSVDLLTDKNGAVYIQRCGHEDGEREMWYIGAITPAMHGMFTSEAHRWLTGEWAPDPHTATRIWAVWPEGLQRVATYEPPDPGACPVWPREKAPAAHDYLTGPLCTSCGYATTAGIEVNAEPVCHDCYIELQEEVDGAALDQIAQALTAGGTGALEAIAAIVRGTGREVSHHEPDDTDCGLADEQS